MPQTVVDVMSVPSGAAEVNPDGSHYGTGLTLGVFRRLTPRFI